jgi:hypothetical protein
MEKGQKLLRRKREREERTKRRREREDPSKIHLLKL